MKEIVKKLLFIAPVISLFLFVTPALAAAPDGAGPWADNVFSSHQGLMKNGLAVPAIRSNPNAAVGVAENTIADGTFYTLGFGGNVALGFDNGVSSGAMVVESTNPNYPIETAKVEMSEDGVHWVMAGNLSQGGTVNQPRGVDCAKYVRITDTSNPANFSDATADGYDVDGVKATGKPCTPKTHKGGQGDQKITCISTSIINQSNTLNVVNGVNVSVNTGDNSANKNKTGSVSITTGNANANVGITIVAGSNVANNTGAACCCTSTSCTN